MFNDRNKLLIRKVVVCLFSFRLKEFNAGIVVCVVDNIIRNFFYDLEIKGVF